MLLATHLSNRTVIRIGGMDRHAFLQGLISNDVGKVTEANAIYAALLTPQGKFLHDLFVVADGESFLVDCDAARVDDLIRRLQAYKLRSKVVFEDATGAFDVWAVWGGEEPPVPRHSREGGNPAPHVHAAKDSYDVQTRFLDPRLRGDDGLRVGFEDPRLDALGARVFVEKNQTPLNTTPTDFITYDTHRLMLGVADGARDMEIEKSTLADGNFDFLNGVDWKKGCYVGQELTARMHYRALVKKRLFPVRITGESPESGVVLDNDAGEMRSSCGEYGLALLRIEAVQKALGEEKPLTHGKTSIWPVVPAWLKLT